MILPYCQKLEEKIVSAYEDGVSLDEAEKLAGVFLEAQIKVSRSLASADLDGRMRKSGLKAVKAAVYMDAASPKDPGAKRPTEAALSAIIDSHELVGSEQDAFDKAEVLRAELERYYNIFREAHIFYRSVARGSIG